MVQIRMWFGKQHFIQKQYFMIFYWNLLVSVKLMSFF